MQDTLKMLTEAEWDQVRKIEHRHEEITARARLLTFFGQHAGCRFRINDRQMTGAQIKTRISAADLPELRAYHDAAKEHRRT